MSSLLDQARYTVQHGKLGLLGSSTHPLVSEKKAAYRPLFPPSFTPHKDAASARNKLLAILAASGLAGLATGGAITGGIGYSKYKELKDKPEALPGNVPLTMPPGRMPPTETEQKVAAEIGGLEHWLGHGAGEAMHHPLAAGGLTPVAVGVGGAWLGSHLMNKYIHNKMKQLRSQNLDRAQADFDQAMLSQYDHPNLRNEKISAALDKLYDKLEKAAAGPPLTDSSSSGAVLGPMALAMLISGGVGMRSGYNWAEGRKPENLLRDAMKQRALIQAQAMPAPVQFQAPVAAKEEEQPVA